MTPTHRLPDPDPAGDLSTSPPLPPEREGERELLERLRAGDETAFEALFRTYYNPLCIFAESYVHSAHLAEELVDDVFCWIWEHRTDWHVEHGAKPYLYGAVRNRALKQIARSRMAAQIEEEAGREDRVLAMGRPPRPTDERVVTDEFARAVELAVASLPPRCRQAYVLHRQHDLTYNQIAELMGTSVKTVENQLARALKTLRMSLAAWKP